MKTLNFLFFSQALELILLRPSCIPNLLLKLHDMTQWIFHPSATLCIVSLQFSQMSFTWAVKELFLKVYSL
jgi:hypothetical protein